MPNGFPSNSPFADHFIEAHGSRWCTPGDAASQTCAALSSPRAINRVVIHVLSVPGTAQGSGVELVVGAWQNPAPAVHPASAHYLVDRDGTITQAVREDNVAFHSGVREVNRDSIGVEHADICNDPAPFTVEL